MFSVIRLMEEFCRQKQSISLKISATIILILYIVLFYWTSINWFIETFESTFISWIIFILSLSVLSTIGGIGSLMVGVLKVINDEGTNGLNRYH